MPRLPDGARVLIVVGEPVDVLNGLADPLETPDKPDVLGFESLGPGLADGLPRIAGAGECRDRGDPGRQIADHSQESVHSGHNCIMPPLVTVHCGLRRIREDRPVRAQPRPTKGIFVAMMVRNCTLALSGSEAMARTASATCSASNVGSATTEPSA